MTKADIHHQDKRLEKALEKHLPAFNGDRKDVKDFLNQLTIEGLSAARLNKYIYTLGSLRKMLKCDFKKASEKDFKTLIVSLEKSDKSSWTKHDYKVVLKRYLRYFGREPSWLKVSNGKNQEVSPEEILSEDEIKRLAESGYTTRDKAIVLALYEGGCRIGEFLPLRLKHVNFDKHGVLLRVTGKTGPRRIRLVFSALPLQRWISEHPGREDPNSFLWCQIPGPYHPGRTVQKNHLSYGFISRHLKELAEKAGVKKAVNAHAFRHARATFMARHLKEPEMREFFGWGKDSEMPSIYVHLSGRDVDNSVLSIYGIKDASKSQEPVLKIFECYRCNEPNDPASIFCHRCGLPFKEEGVEAEIKLESVVVELLKVIANTNPTIKDRFREIVRARGAEDLFI